MSQEVVYVFQCGEYYKIGRTKNVSERLRQVSAHIPFPLTLIYSHGCEYADLEAIILRAA